MSNSNNPAIKQIFIGVAIAVISAVILASLGLSGRLPEIGNSDDKLLKTQPEPEPNNPIPTDEKPIKSEVLEMELEEFYSEWRSNSAQIKDNFDFNLTGKKMVFIGYLYQNSIYDCDYDSDQRTRCMKFYSAPYTYGSGRRLTFVFEPENIEQTRDINRLLY